MIASFKFKRMEIALSTYLSTREADIAMVVKPTNDDIGYDTNVTEPTSHNLLEGINTNKSNQKPKLPWDKLSKFVQWKMFTAYMHEHDLTDGNLFKRMRSMVSEKRTNAFVEFNVEEQKIIHVDFKHEVFIRERSKKGKLRVQLAQSSYEAQVKALEASINGQPFYGGNIEVIDEEHLTLE